MHQGDRTQVKTVQLRTMAHWFGGEFGLALAVLSRALDDIEEFALMPNRNLYKRESQRHKAASAVRWLTLPEHLEQRGRNGFIPASTVLAQLGEVLKWDNLSWRDILDVESLIVVGLLEQAYNGIQTIPQEDDPDVKTRAARRQRRIHPLLSPLRAQGCDAAGAGAEREVPGTLPDDRECDEQKP